MEDDDHDDNTDVENTEIAKTENTRPPSKFEIIKKIHYFEMMP